MPMSPRLLRPLASGVHPEANAWRTAVVANGGSVSASTRRSCSSTNACNAARSAGRVRARKRIASSAALVAPAAPIENVAVGIPPGIWTIDNKLSRPESAFDCTGTPSTCMTVCGDGTTAGGEECDDRGTSDGDGCTATCAFERGHKVASASGLGLARRDH